MSTREEDQGIRLYQKKAIAHGCMVIMVGLLAGIMFTFSVLGEISFWPLFSMTVEIPGETALWRGAHIGPIMNGLLCIILVMSLSFVNADLHSAKKVCLCLILTAWGNTIFFVARLWGTNRGLAMHTEKYGDGNVFDLIALTPAFLVVGLGIYAVVVIIKLALKADEQH